MPNLQSNDPKPPRAIARLQPVILGRKLEAIRLEIERKSGSAELARRYIEKILLDVEFLRDNNRAGLVLSGLDGRYRRWNVTDQLCIIYLVEQAGEEIRILDVRLSDWDWKKKVS